MSETQDTSNVEESKAPTQVELTKDGGVVKEILEEGTGEQPKSGDSVEVHYRGTLEDGTEFDCSYKREPLSFKAGTGMVIKGWDLGILSMKVGEKAKLTIKSSYGYGDAGSPPKIPGGATLIFEVELVSVNKDNADDDTDEDQTDEQLMENCKNQKAEGNELFKKGELMDALAKYREAIMSLDDLEDDSTAEAKESRKLINLNIATVTKKMEKWQEVVKATSNALEIEENNVKGLFFRAIANRHLKEFELATEDLKAAIKTSPNDKALRNEFATMKEEKKKYLESQKGAFEKAFAGGLYSEKKEPSRKVEESEVPKYDPSNPKVFMDIKIGDADPKKIIFELFKNKTPLTVDNFKCLCTGEKSTDEQLLHYKGNKFHRIIPDFMAQGGDFTRGNGTGGRSIYGEKFDDEQVWIPHSEKGLLSMANAGPNTNGSQFFITFTQTPHLDGKHTVFGRVIKGWDVVKEMESVKTGEKDIPESSVVIEDCGEYTEEIEESQLELTKE